MKKLLLTALLLGLFATPAYANTAQIPGFNCSVTAYTPWSINSSLIGYQGGTSCGGWEYNYSKHVTTCAQIRGANDYSWFNISNSCEGSGWTTATALQSGGAILYSVPGHLYRIYAHADISHNGMFSGADVYSQNYLR